MSFADDLNNARELATEYFDLMLGTDCFGATCTLYYPPRFINCNNCYQNQSTGKSTNIYLHGGPIPFENMVCPQCGGSYKIAQEMTEDIVMHFIWNASQYASLPGLENVVIPQGSVLSRGFMTDLPKVRKCIKMRPDKYIEGMGRPEYELMSEAWDNYNFVQGRYFVAIWRRKA